MAAVTTHNSYLDQVAQQQKSESHHTYFSDEKAHPPKQGRKHANKGVKTQSQKSKHSTTASWTGSFERHKPDTHATQSANSEEERSNQAFATQLISKLESQSDTSQKAKMATLASQVSRLVCTQSGSRFLQKELNKADSNFVEFILNDIGSSLAEIMVDTYGNYFCQKLVSCCSLKQSSHVLSLI